MSNITEKLGATSLENKDFEQISKKIEEICFQKDLSQKETDDIPQEIKERGLPKAVKVVIDDFDIKWINTITLYIFDKLKYKTIFGGYFDPRLSSIQNNKINAVVVLPMAYPDFDYAVKIFNDGFYSKRGRKPSDDELENIYKQYVENYKEYLTELIQHEFRHVFDRWSEHFNSQQLFNKKK